MGFFLSSFIYNPTRALHSTLNINSCSCSIVTDIKATTIHKYNETNDKFYRKVAFLMYTEMVNFTPQS